MGKGAFARLAAVLAAVGAFTGARAGGECVVLQGDTTFSVASGTEEISGVVSGTGGLTKAGAGTLTLSNLRNTYAGPTTVSAGNLYFSSIANVGEASSLGCPLTANQGALTLNGSGTARLAGIGEQTTDRPIVQGSKATFYVNSGAALTTTGPWTGRFSVRGSGTIRVASRLTASSISRSGPS